ncbi:hypothetical protein HYPSUDRAFT_198619 [Hypholoma sublateritium FD-334 SS-4]|uniref:Uncharacterized protein n=1 Tax=Hypholoma sublateritium (strain FD-334 SS-4) TaxID=945553 RepID=A0A0D2MS52_HYPSF|nr:hypothetical protein HYPSUDRAFT_198619 [Hypholoma sublateritium FD-334 SS-4]
MAANALLPPSQKRDSHTVLNLAWHLIYALAADDGALRGTNTRNATFEDGRQRSPPRKRDGTNGTDDEHHIVLGDTILWAPIYAPHPKCRPSTTIYIVRISDDEGEPRRPDARNQTPWYGWHHDAAHASRGTEAAEDASHTACDRKPSDALQGARGGTCKLRAEN